MARFVHTDLCRPCENDSRKWIALLWRCSRRRPDPNMNPWSHKHFEIAWEVWIPLLFVHFAVVNFQPLIWTTCGFVCAFYYRGSQEEPITRINPKSPAFILINLKITDLTETTSGLKEFIKCCSIFWLLVYISYKQCWQRNRLFSAIGYWARTALTNSKTQSRQTVTSKQAGRCCINKMPLIGSFLRGLWFFSLILVCPLCLFFFIFFHGAQSQSASEQYHVELLYFSLLFRHLSQFVC